jgi:hypothetical protein
VTMEKIRWAETIRRIYNRLIQCTEAQLDYIQVQLGLPSALIARQVTASRAKVMLDLLEARPDKDWVKAINGILDQGADAYLGNRLSAIKDFLIDADSTAGASAESVGTIKDLRERLADVGQLNEPLDIKVRGTLFPAALLTAGWWERGRAIKSLAIPWKNPLQAWLFKGFDLWAPSWDVCWGAVDPDNTSKEYYIAQLTEGDEADSLPVIVGRERAVRLSHEFSDGWGGFEATIVGRLGHRYQFAQKLPLNEKRSALDFYISVEDDNKRHKINRLAAPTELYSAYLWKVLAPEEWYRDKPMLALDEVYFVWEHTNFVAKDAVDYNLASLEHKEQLIAKHHPGSKLILLQKSHSIVPGEPQWPVDRFYQSYLMQGKEI